MRKILTVALCAVLCLCMVLPILAAGTAAGDYTGDSQGQEVKISIGGDIVHVYLVDIEFTTSTFSYNSDGYKWNPNEYKYEHSAGATWTGEGTVKIVNHSDLPVNYTVEKENVVSTYGPLDIVFAGNAEGTIEKCTTETVKGSQNATTTYTVTGTPTVTSITAQKLGEIKAGGSYVFILQDKDEKRPENCSCGADGIGIADCRICPHHSHGTEDNG